MSLMKAARLKTKSIVTASNSAVVAVLILVQPVNANPEVPTVVNGTAAFATHGATLEVTNSDGAIIEWQRFSIAADETTRFVQPDAASSVLNRITGQDPSHIIGNLMSNGRVFLINPNGIVFGGSAVVDTAGLIASTLNLSNENFLAGRYEFAGDGSEGSIVNGGVIAAAPGGEVVLIAPSVENSGIVHAPDGTLILAAGHAVTLSSLDLQGVTFELQAPDNDVINLGELIAKKGALGLFAGTLEHSGAIEAESISIAANGDIILGAGTTTLADGASGGEIAVASASGTTWVSGEVSAAGSQGAGGEVRLLGRQVGLIDDARVDASGTAGGGEILIGGDYRGGGDVQTAEGTFVGDGVAINADATDEGDGGRVIVWADGATRAYGEISARGGDNGGDGGFVETSGEVFLDVTATPDVRAPHGQGGQWLLDPHNITIQVGTGTLDGASPNFLATVDDSTIDVAVINAALDADTTVTIDTNTGSPAQVDDLGDVTINADIVKNSGGLATGLIFNVDNNFTLNSANQITDNSGAGLDIEFNVSNTSTIDGDINTAQGNINFNTGTHTIANTSTVTSNSASIAGGVSNNATVIVDGGTWNNTTAINVGGDSSIAALTAQAGGTVQADGLSIAVGAGSQGDVLADGAGTQIVLTGFGANIEQGTGDITIQNGAVIDASCGGCGVTIGDAAGSTASLTIDGANSRLDVANFLDVARANVFTLANDGFDYGVPGGTTNATVDVLNSGTLNTASASLSVGPGGGSPTGAENSIVTFTVDNATWNDSSGVDVGQQRDATLNIQNGANVNWTGFNTIAAAGSSSGTVNVTGAGSVLDLGGGDLVVANGATDPGFGTVGTTNGTLNITGGGTVRNALTVGAGNGFNLDGGNTVGTINVDGAGSLLETAGVDSAVRLGNSGGEGAAGRGIMNVSAGGRVNTWFLDIGRSGEDNVATVTDSGSLIDISDDYGSWSPPDDVFGAQLRIGRDSGDVGTLNVLNGAAVQLRTNNNTDGAGIQIARNEGSNGTMLVDGTGSNVTLSRGSPTDPDNNIFGNFFFVGRGGQGALTVSNGARVDFQSENSGLQIARDSTGSGTITVTGEGSEIYAGEFDSGAHIGRAGTGTLRLEEGGSMQAIWLNVGRDVGSTGTLIVDGDQNTVTGEVSRLLMGGNALEVDGELNATFLTVGRDGNGTMLVEDGGLVQIDGGDFEFPGFQAGRTAGSVGLITVDDAGGTGTDATTGSRIVVTSNLTGLESGFIRAARNDGSTGTIEVLNGGQIINDADGNGYVAPIEGSVGTIRVDGANAAGRASVFDAGNTLYVGVDVTPLFSDSNASPLPGGDATIEELNGASIIAGRFFTVDDIGVADPVTVNTNEILAVVDQSPGDAGDDDEDDDGSGTVALDAEGGEDSDERVVLECR